jgi:hypothetical protein
MVQNLDTFLALVMSELFAYIKRVIHLELLQYLEVALECSWLFDNLITIMENLYHAMLIKLIEQAICSVVWAYHMAIWLMILILYISEFFSSIFEEEGTV